MTALDTSVSYFRRSAFYAKRYAALLSVFGAVGCVVASEEPGPGGDGDGDGDGDQYVAGVGGTFVGNPNSGGAPIGVGTGGDGVGPGVGGSVFGSGGMIQPVNCAGIESAGFDLCDSDETSCGAVYTGGEGCAAVCAAAGLVCETAFENLTDVCGADEARPALGCDSGHESDYCVCVSDGTNQGSGGTGSGGAGSGGSGSGGAGSGGSGSGGAGSGGSGSGGAGSGGSGSGGAGSGGSGSGGSGTGGSPNIGPRTCGCTQSAGEFGTVSNTIVVGNGQTYDGGCKIFRADPDELGDGSQEEGQLPIFRLNNGARLRNVIIGASGADGIHTYGNVELENIHWLDIGEDALTIKDEGTVELDCGSSNNGDDKTFQINAESTFYISNFTGKNAGKLIRQLGGSTFETNVFIDHCDISGMDEAIYRTDASSSHVTMTNTRYHDIGTMFIFGDDEVNGNSSQSTVSNNQSY